MGFGKTLGALVLGIGSALLPADIDAGVYKTRHNTYDTSKPLIADKYDKGIGCNEVKLICAVNGQDSSYLCEQDMMDEDFSYSRYEIARQKRFEAIGLLNRDHDKVNDDLKVYNILIKQAERRNDTAEAHALVLDAEKSILNLYFKYCFLYSDCIEFDTVIVRGR